ncbi:hypothetical protein ACE6H2_025077 [Prunus campanulata]
MLAWLVTLALVSKLFFPQSNKLKLPPGPKPWPIIGNLNLIGPLPHQSLHKLSQIYGPIMQLKFGSYPVVIASSAEKAKQFSRTHDHIFASRPPTAAGKYTAYNYSNLIWAPNGPYWRQGPKICLSHLFRPKMLDSYEYIRVEESRAFLSRLCAFSGKPTMLKEHLLRLTLSIISRVVLGKPVTLKEHISRLTLSTVSRIVLGKEYFSESQFVTSTMTLREFQDMLDELVCLSGVLNIGDWIPWLKFFDLQGYVKQMKALNKKFDLFHDYILNEHKAKKKEETNFVPKDMVDLLLQLVDDPDLEVKLNRDSVKGFTQVSPCFVDKGLVQNGP